MHLILKPTAIQMVKEAYNWYEEQKNDLGETFMASLNDCLTRIQLYPKANTRVRKNYRQARLKIFPYVVVYEIINSDIVVLSVFHTSGNPKYKFV